MLSEFLFYAMLACFSVHELDAVKRHEWRVLPLTRVLPERAGEQVFIWAHVPIYLAIFWFAARQTTSGVALALSGFAILHVGLHWWFRNHPANEFNNPGSWALILGTGALGGLHLLAVLAR